MLQRGLKAKLLLWRARTNDAGVITDQDGENESRLKRLCQASSAFESIASHYRSSLIDISIRSTSYFFTRGHVAFIDYPRHYAKASKTPFELYLSRTVKSFAVTLLDVGRNRGLSLSLALAKGRNARTPLL